LNIRCRPYWIPKWL